jgi:hypothetical protein
VRALAGGLLLLVTVLLAVVLAEAVYREGPELSRALREMPQVPCVGVRP